VHDETGQSTYCHGCGARLIGRDWYTITAWGLDLGGRCAACGEICPGQFEALPGSWGARREPMGYRRGMTENSFRQSGARY